MIKLMSNSLIGSKHLRVLIIIAVLVNCFGLFFPVFGSNDSNFYSVIAKHIVENNDWLNLTFAGQDWLDKPHFPFWLTAISYKVFGFSTFAYILPGFIFNLVGAFYTFLLARHLYNKETGLMAALFYLTSIHILLSSIDVRAEAFLLGEIIPASYYWLRYSESDSISRRYLLLGALFTAMAIMTKGMFVLITISSGLICLNIYTKKFKALLSYKWLIALLLVYIFILPELYALYTQFDQHPEKVIFGHTNVSGVRFFFWDSQFGRFFDSGPITSGHPAHFSHYFYFVHTFLWAYLPWTAIFIIAVWQIFKDFRFRDLPENKQGKANYVYLIGSFVPTFILFSLTSFQLDHYTNIIIPFAAVLSANWVENKATRLNAHLVFKVQISLAFLLLLAVIVLSILIFSGNILIFSLSLCLLVLVLFIVLTHNYPLTKAIIYPFLAINLVSVFIILINGKVYSAYDVGYKINSYLQNYPKGEIIDYNVASASLEFNAEGGYKRVESTNQLPLSNYYLVINTKEWPQIESQVSNSTIMKNFLSIRQDKFIPTIFNHPKREANTEQVLLIKVGNESDD